jgi:hypothetical protein
MFSGDDECCLQDGNETIISATSAYSSRQSTDNGEKTSTYGSLLMGFLPCQLELIHVWLSSIRKAEGGQTCTLDFDRPILGTS